MNHHRNMMAGLALAALAFAYGCAPAMLGDTTRPGNPPGTLIAVNKQTELLKGSKANVVSKGEALDVTITTASGESCAANLKLKEAVKSWPILSFIPGLSGSAYLDYRGTWGNDLPASCLELIQAPGGSHVQATVGEDSTIMGGRPLGLLTKTNPGDLDIQAKSSLSYVVPTVKGVDD